MNFLKKSEKRVRFQDDVAVTGVSRKKLKLTQDKKDSENSENSEKTDPYYVEDYHKAYCENQRLERLRSCYTPERVKRVCPDFKPDLDFSIGWAKKFLRRISM